MVRDYGWLKDRRLVIGEIAKSVCENRVAIVLGSGISSSTPFCFPSWKELIKKIELSFGVPVNPSTDYPQRLDYIKEITVDQTAFNEAVWEALYPACLRIARCYPEDLLGHKLFLAITDLILTGGISNILTLNYDDIYDWYLADLRKIQINTITDIAQLNTKKTINVIHLHGYLPLRQGIPASNWIIASGQEYEDRRHIVRENKWGIYLSSEFWSKVVIFIGASVTGDQDIVDYVTSTSNLRQASIEDYAGFAIGCWSKSDRDKLEDIGIVPVTVDDYQGIPQLIREVLSVSTA